MTTFVAKYYTRALAEYLNRVGYSYDSLGIQAGQWNVTNVGKVLQMESLFRSEEHRQVYGPRSKVVDDLVAEQGFEEDYLGMLGKYYQDFSYKYKPTRIDKGKWSTTSVAEAIPNTKETSPGHLIKYAPRPEILQKLNTQSSAVDEFQLIGDKSPNVQKGQNLTITGTVTDNMDSSVRDDWTGVAQVADGLISGSCVTHKSGIFMLTAGHVVEGLDLSRARVTFDVNEKVETRDVIGSTTYPRYSITDSGVWHDVGILALDQSAPEEADRYELYRAEDEIGHTVDLVGYGASQERQVGENVVRDLATEVMRKGSLEDQLVFGADTGAMITPGDSGGGMFIQDDDPLLAGLHSYIVSFDQESVADDIGVSTRVSSYAEWIDWTTGVAQNPESRGSTPPSTDSVPMQVYEGEGVWFLAQLGAPAQEYTSVHFHTRDGSAEAGRDYISTHGTLSLKPGEQWAKIWVQTLADDVLENEETFELVLSDPQGASFAQGSEEIAAERTIIDDVSLTGVTELQPELYLA